MFHKGKPVPSSDISNALESLIQFLLKQGNCTILSGHNIKSFDCHVLLHAIEACGKMESFKSCVAGFVDTKLLFRSQFPGLSSYAQQDLLTSFIKSDYPAHDALQDVIYLQTLVCSVDVCDESRRKAAFSVSSAIYSHDSLKFSSLNLPLLQGLIDSKIITMSMGKKMATSDLNYAILKLAYCRAEEEGVRQVLSEECGGKPRVTRSTKIIHALAEHFKSTLSNAS